MIEKLQKDYNGKFKKIKEEKAQFLKKMKNWAKNSLKKKNDEIIRVYLEIKEKYDSICRKRYWYKRDIKKYLMNKYVYIIIYANNIKIIL